VKGPTITIITGKSGSGKSTAMAAFEDSGYYCVDNMPVALLPAFLKLPIDYGGSFVGLALGMDLREKEFIHQYEAVLKQLTDKGFRFRIIFIDADEKALLRRYSQTRRKHPLAIGKSISEAVAEEADMLTSLRRSADTIIDTSDLNVHELKSIIRQIADSGSGASSLRVHVISFGFKFGLPVHADLVMDVRFLKNPYFVESLRAYSGETEKIRTFVLNNDQTCLFLQKYFDLLDTLIPQYENEGKAYLTIAIGCTGGRHRSVVIARELRDHLTASGYKAELTHRDIDKTHE
jgi:RNase adapter protein RapZ